MNSKILIDENVIQYKDLSIECPKGFRAIYDYETKSLSFVPVVKQIINPILIKL